MRGLEKNPSARHEHVPAFADALRDAYAAASLVREPSRSFTAGGGGGGAFEPSRQGAESGGTFAFAAVLVGTLVVGLALVFAFAGPSDDELALADGALLDMGPPDAGANMTPHEREEAAKDAIDDARRRLEAGDFPGARASLGLAQQLDPGNSDIGAMRAALRAATPTP